MTSTGPPPHACIPLADKARPASDDVAVPPARTRVSLYLPTSTVRRIRGLVAALHGTDDQVSFNELADAALRSEAARIERAKNGGEQYPPADEVGRGAGGRRG